MLWIAAADPHHPSRPPEHSRAHPSHRLAEHSAAALVARRLFRRMVDARRPRNQAQVCRSKARNGPMGYARCGTQPCPFGSWLFFFRVPGACGATDDDGSTVCVTVTVTVGVGMGGLAGPGCGADDAELIARIVSTTWRTAARCSPLRACPRSRCSSRGVRPRPSA